MSTIEETPAVEVPSASDASGVGGSSTPLETTTPESESKSRKRLLIILGVILALLLLVAGIFVWYLITHKPITALPGLTDNATPHYNYSIYEANQPLGVAVNADGSRIYVTQSGGKQTTLVFDANGHVIQTLVPPTSTGPNHLPVYVALDPKTGEAYVSDRMAGAIYVYSPNGTYERTFPHVGVTGVWAPLGMAFDNTEHLFVTEAFVSTKKIYEFSTSGHLVHTFTTPTAMSFPNGVAVDAKGDIVVTDGNNGRALFLDQSGKLIGEINAGMAKGDLGLPRGIVFDSQGHLDIVDATDQSIRVYTFDGTTTSYVGTFGDQGVGDGLFEYPNGIAADNRAHVYVTDRVNNRVQVWSY